MRIVHAVCTDAFAGVERHVAMLAAAECDAGHDVLVIGGAQPIMREVIDRPAVRHVAAVTVPEMARALNRASSSDVFNLHMTSAEVAAALAHRSRRVPAVSTRHFAAHRGRSSRLAAFVARRAAQRLSTQIAVSNYVAAHIEPPSHVIVSGVPSQADAVRAGGRGRSILVAQRLEEEKRTADAISMFARSGLATDGWRLDIAGEGVQRLGLERLAHQLGVSGRVHFLGMRTDIDELMRSAAILVAPRIDEALGLAVLEAMSFGLPVVAAGAGGHLETLGSVAPELCFAACDVDAGAALLRRLAHDPALRDEAGHRLQQAQRAHFSIAAQAVATEAVYRSLL